ncbi:MAG: asparagine synthase (glutamine-hydrolyzing) [Desulfomonilaceae bacterium]
MCGIVGYYGDFDKNALSNMNDMLAHRGPDASGLFYADDAPVGLGHRRLSIIDLSPAGAQPMWDAEKQCVITFNGEIYNYRELREDLLQDGFKFNSKSDTEIILNLYIRDGLQMLNQLNGIFAFGIFDTRDKSLLLARDGFGVKPLYYTVTSKGLTFSSELKTLLLEPSVNRRLSREALHYYLSYSWAPSPWTMLKDVKKLEPGRALVVNDKRIVKEKAFYQVPTKTNEIECNEAEAIQMVYSALGVAVRRQMVADVPVGAFLSGGLDSSSICAFARKHVPDGRLRCFTIEAQGFEEEGFVDDLKYARMMASYLGVSLEVIQAGAKEISDHMEKMVYHMDEPLADTASINTMMIAKLARDSGITVLLSGTGGDDLFAGYERHLALELEKLWAWAPELFRKLLSRIARELPIYSPVMRRLAKVFRFANLTPDKRIAGYFHLAHPDIEMSILSEESKSALKNERFSQPLMNSLKETDSRMDRIERMLYLDAKHYLIDNNLLYTDKMTMAHGIEARVPFLDPDLANIAANLPKRMKFHNTTGKYILKQAMKTDLPMDIIERPKTGFGIPIRRLIKNELRESFSDLLSENSLRSRGLFDPNGVRKLLELDSQGKIDAANLIFTVGCVEMWARIFVDKPMKPL